MNKVGVLILHGVGIQQAGYSARLVAGIRNRLRESDLDDTKVSFTEVLYSDIFDAQQDQRAQYLIQTSSWWHPLSRLIRWAFIYIFSDAVSYRARYKNVHLRISQQLAQLKTQLDEDAVIIVAAHSMGIMAISDYIYDEQQGLYPQLKLQSLGNIKQLVSFGCNIPLFEMGHEQTRCIQRPPLDAMDKQFNWINYYTATDVLGYRIANYYTIREEAFDIVDIKIRAGGLLTWNTPLSHQGYWKSSHIHKQIATTIANYI